MDYGNKPEPTAPRPELDVAYTDPTFGSVLTRLTDPSQAPSEAGKPTLGVIHEYSRFPVSNADNRLAVTVVIGGAERGSWRVWGIREHVVYHRIETNGDPEFSWHPTDPYSLFYRFGNEIRIFHVDSGQAEMVMNFPQYQTIGANEEGRPSDDWHYYACIGVRPSGQRDILVADLQTRTVIATRADVGSNIDWVSMSPSGKYVIAMHTDGPGTLVYDRSLAFQRTLISDYSHSDFAYDGDGNEVLVYIASTGDQINELGCPNPPNGSPIATARLSDGQKKIVLGECNTADWAPVVTGTLLGWWFDVHFSGIISRARPGWVLASTYTAPENPQNPFTREIFLVKLDGSGEVERLAHHRSLVGTLPNGDRDYFAEPHASSSWDGSRVFFASTWGATGEHYDLYSIQLGGGTITPPPPPPPPPDDTTVDFSTAQVRWTWKQGAVSEFHVYCGPRPGDYTTVRVVKNPAARSVPLNKVIARPGKYYLMVVAMGAGGESAPSNEVFFHAVGKTPAPGAVENVGVGP